MNDSFEARLQATLNVIPAHTWYATPNGALTFVNKLDADYAGLPSNHHLRLGIDIGAAWDSHLAWLHPDDHDETRKVWSTCLKTGSAGELTFRVRDAHGAYHWRLSRVEPLRGDGGKLLYWIGINLDVDDLKRAERDLRDILDTIPGMVWVALPDGSNTYVNGRYVEYSGMSAGQVAASGWRAAVHPDDLERHEGNWRATLASGKPHESEVRFRRADGQYRWHLDRGLPLRDETGEIIKWYGTVTDIEDRKRAEDALRRSEYFLAEAQRLSLTGSFGWNVSTDEHYWSDETFRIFEFEAAKVSLPMILQRIHPQDIPTVEMAIAAAERAEGIDLEFRLRMPDDRIKYLHVVGRATKADTGSTEIIGAVMDVTTRKLTEIELRRSKAQLTDAQVLSHVGSVGMEVSTKRLFWSDEAARIYGYAPGTEPTPDLILQRVHPEDVHLVRGSLERAERAAGDFDYEHRLLMPDGSIKHIYNFCHRHKDEAGNTEVTGAIMDITERRLAEAELRQVLDLAPQIIGVQGPQRERLYANRVALAYYGVSLEEWRQRSFGTEVHPEDFDRVKAHIDRSLSHPAAYELELRLRKQDGTYRWFLVRYNPLCDDQGRLVRWYLACTDIDDRKRAEERLQEENVALREEIDKTSMFEEIVGSSPALIATLSRVSKVAGSDSTVLITGETGTGKELIARAIHRRSERSANAFVAVNCAAIPRDLIASELFGHERGAFTGAVQRRVGRFELANGGTIFLDEVAELSPEMQASLLRVLQEREIEHIGGTKSIPVDVRVIAATNRNLTEGVAGGTFREDLFYRLNVFPIEMPPLRDRKQDIPVLVEYFIHRYAAKAHKTFRRVSKKTLSRLQSYPWPGNVRELQSVIERSVIVCDTEEFVVDGSWLTPQHKLDGAGALASRLSAYEKALIEEALLASGGQVFGPTGAAARLRLPRTTLESRIRALRINKSRFRPQPD
jgi:formate hydrogenlyase transcriptional activator